MKKIPIWIWIVLFLTVLIASKFVFFAKKEDKTNSSKTKVAIPIAVNYFVVKPVSINSKVFATGKTGAINQVDLVSEASGKITQLFFKEGETLKKGSAMVKINDTDLQAQLLKIKTQLKLSSQKLERLKKLLEVKGISEEEFETQENELAVLKAEEALVNAQIAKTLVTAPFDGVVGLKQVSEGSFVNPNTPLVSLVQLKPMYIEFAVPEKYSNRISKGTKVNFQPEQDVLNGEYTAEVYAVEPVVDAFTKTIRARALYNGNSNLYPGSFVKVFVNLGAVQNALMVPTQCVIPTLKSQKVFVCKNQTAVEVPVKIGVRSDETIQITEGLQQGDTVIVTGLLSLKKDSKLKLLNH